MSGIICEFCNKTYSSKSSLNNHQKTTKKCIEIQNKMSKNKENKDNNIIKFSCKYCNKNLTSKQNIKIHENSCSYKKEYENELKDIKNKCEELEKQNKNYLEEIQKLREINAELKGELKNANRATDCIYEIAKQPKNITNTNNSKTLNITGTLDFNDIDKIKEIIDTKYNINHLLSGQKGFAHFAAQNLLKDEEGNYNYTCTDPSRQIFKFKNTKGEIEKDIEAKKLTNYLVEGGIKDKALDISLSWCQNEGKIDKEKFIFISEKQDSILNIKENNSEFKKELVSLVTQK